MSKEKIEVIVDKDLEDLIPNFMDNRKKDVVKLKEHLAAKDFKQIVVIGHKMAGNSGGYGFHQLGVYGGEIEEAAEAESVAPIEKNIAAIEEYLSNIEIKFE